jgi:CHAT domain-containing protein
LRNFIKKLDSKRSLLLAILLFIISSAIPSILAKSEAAQALHAGVALTQQDGRQLASQAKTFYLDGRFEEAAALWRQTATVFAKNGDRLNRAMALSNLSLTYQQLGQWQKAQEAIAQSWKLLPKQPQERASRQILAQTLEIRGYLQREIGQSADALDSWQQATKIYRQIDEPAKIVQSQVNQAQAMQDLGLYPRACKTLLEVLRFTNIATCQDLTRLTSEELTKKLQTIDDRAPAQSIVALRSLGELLRVTGQLEQSQAILARSLDLAKTSQERADTYLSLGNTLQALVQGEKVRRRRENYERRALDAYKQAVKLSTVPKVRQQAQLNQLSLLLKGQQFSEAETLWRSLASQLSKLSPSRTGIYLQLNLAQNLIKSLQEKSNAIAEPSQPPTIDEIDRILTKAAEQAKSIKDKRAEAYALGSRGTLYEKQNPSQAEQLTQQALSLASSLETPDIAYQYFWQLGRIRKAKGDIPDAIAAYTKAYDILQSLRGDLVALNREIQFSFRDSVEPVYRELVELNLDRASSLKNSDKEAEKQELLNRARNVIESLQIAEINNFFREACVETNAQPIDRIDRTAAVIYPIILRDRLDVLLSVPDRPLRLYSHRVDAETLENLIDNVQRSLIAPQSVVREFLPSYQQLYDWLIRPLEKDLADSKIKTLVFVLDGDLRNIPMSVLYDGKQYLVENYALALTPGLQLLNPKPLAEIDFQALTAGISKAHQGFMPLVNVPSELGQIKAIGLSERSLLNEQFTSSQIEREIFNFRFPIVHLATHAQFSSNAEDTFILAWDRRINVKQLDDLLRDNNLERPRPIELLVLSACETASGDKRAALGLAGVAIQAGARSTLATLWSVADESTTKLMGEFYRQLEQAKQTKIDKAQAIRQAQLTLIKDRQYNHPHFWAPFILIGNWQ